MRIFEERTYTMYLNEEEFGLLYEITKHIPYSYLYDTEENEYRIVMDEEMLDDIYEELKEEESRQLYEECNRARALEIRDLLDDIYMELR